MTTELLLLMIHKYAYLTHCTGVWHILLDTCHPYAQGLTQMHKYAYPTHCTGVWHILLDMCHPYAQDLNQMHYKFTGCIHYNTGLCVSHMIVSVQYWPSVLVCVCVSEWVCVCVHTCMHACMLLCVCVYVHACVRACTSQLKLPVQSVMVVTHWSYTVPFRS